MTKEQFNFVKVYISIRGLFIKFMNAYNLIYYLHFCQFCDKQKNLWKFSGEKDCLKLNFGFKIMVPIYFKNFKYFKTVQHMLLIKVLKYWGELILLTDSSLAVYE